MRWGQGSLQEIDHVPFVRPLVKLAATAGVDRRDPRPGRRGAATSRCARTRARRSSTSRSTSSSWRRRGRAAEPSRAAAPRAPTRRALDRAAALLRDAERPVIMAGTNLYWGHGEDALRALAEARGIPVFLNGLARGCLPADHPLFFSRARSAGAQGRRRRARHRRADGLPARLRRRVRRGDRARRRSTSPSPSASTRARSPPSSTATWPETLRRAARAPRRARHARLARAAARGRGRRSARPSASS